MVKKTTMSPLTIQIILQLSIISVVGKSQNSPHFTTYLGESDWNIFKKIPLPLEASKNVLNGWYFFYWWVGYIFGNLSWIVSDDSTQKLNSSLCFWDVGVFSNMTIIWLPLYFCILHSFQLICVISMSEILLYLTSY